MLRHCQKSTCGRVAKSHSVWCHQHHRVYAISSLLVVGIADAAAVHLGIIVLRSGERLALNNFVGALPWAGLLALVLLKSHYDLGIWPFRPRNQA